MIQQELIAYFRQIKEEGHSIDSVKSVLLQQGWAEQDILESAIAASAPAAPSSAVPVAPVKKVIEKKIPDYYISPLSVLLAAVLFFSLFTLTGQILKDVEGVLVPYSADRLTKTPAYERLSEQYSSKIPEGELTRLKSLYEANHESDKINMLFVQGVLSVVFWVVAFAIHYTIGGSRRHFLPLSVPFFLTAGTYLVSTLFGVIEQLFKKEAQMAIYVTLILFIVIVTISFMFYQKRSHAEHAV